MQAILAQSGYEALWQNRGGCCESILNTALLHLVFFMLQHLQVGKISVKGWLGVHISLCTPLVTLYRPYVNMKNIDNLIGLTGSLNKTNSGECKRGISDSRQQIDLKEKEKNQVQFKLREIKGTSSRSGALSSVSKASVVV